MTTEPKKERIVAAKKEKKCTICGELYTYPTKGSRATRHKCELCADLPLKTAKILKKMNDRIRLLETQLKQFTKTHNQLHKP
jgi:hypothetical protein